MKNEIKYYDSPRITYEVLDCAFPLTFDQYSNCGFSCLYCFSGFQRAKGNSKEAYNKKEVHSVNVDKIKKLFRLETKSPLNYFIEQRMPLQWGGLSDPFCPFEERMGVGLELLKFFNEIKYPISFSSKGDLILRDKRYLDEFKKAGDRWHYKASIITDETDKARIFEAGVSSPDRRFEVLRALSDVGTLTTLRIRPFIIGLTEKTLESLVRKGKEAGCQSVSAEFMCLEMRVSKKENIKAKYNLMSKTLGYDVVKYYKKNTKGSGYLRLNYNLKKPFIQKLVKLCEKYKMGLLISDAHHKEKSCSGNCCGVLNSNKNISGWNKVQFTNALQIAKKNGIITFDDLVNEDPKQAEALSKIKLVPALNTKQEERYRNFTLLDWLRFNWNNIKKATSPYKYFEGILEPVGKDDKGNVVYKYNYKKAKI